MAKLSPILDDFKLSFQELKGSVHVDQVLSHFNARIELGNKILCPKHKEKTASAQIYEGGVFCFGCHQFFDVPELIKLFLEKQLNKEMTWTEVFETAKTIEWPAKGSININKHVYEGEVPPNLVEYWYSCMTDEKYTQLEQERLIAPWTAKQHRIGWRPDTQAWVIPFYRGELGNSPIDTLQFRNTQEGMPKYVGLTNHVRGAVMNAFLLAEKQEYIVILFGSFDSILAYQDDILAVGLNGSMPFRKDEKERVQELFDKQDTIFIVPDNTPAEYKSASQLASWLNAEIRYFPIDFPENTDYIDYRKLDWSPTDFLQVILEIEPIIEPDPDLIEDIVTLLRVGDKNKLASIHVRIRGRGEIATDIARCLVKQLPASLKNFSNKRRLWGVRTSDALLSTLDFLSDLSYDTSGGW